MKIDKIIKKIYTEIEMKKLGKETEYICKRIEQGKKISEYYEKAHDFITDENGNWILVEVDDDGNPILDNNGNYILAKKS